MITRRSFVSWLAAAGSAIASLLSFGAGCAAAPRRAHEPGARERNEEMLDEFEIRFSWVGELLRRSGTAVFAPGSREQAIIDRLKDGWGTRDTAGLLRELTAEHGDLAGRTVERFLEVNVRRDWTQLGKERARPGTEIDDFIQVLWEPLRAQGFEFTIEKDATSARFRVTRCPIHELAQKTGLHEWCYHLACATDDVSTPAFSDRIEFSRTKTLMQGHDCCDHAYRYRS